MILCAWLDLLGIQAIVWPFYPVQPHIHIDIWTRSFLVKIIIYFPSYIFLPTLIKHCQGLIASSLNYVRIHHKNSNSLCRRSFASIFSYSMVADCRSCHSEVRLQERRRQRWHRRADGEEWNHQGGNQDGHRWSISQVHWPAHGQRGLWYLLVADF